LVVSSEKDETHNTTVLSITMSGNPSQKSVRLIIRCETTAEGGEGLLTSPKNPNVRVYAPLGRGEKFIALLLR